MADRHLDTALVNAGRSEKYTQGSVNSVIQHTPSLVFNIVEAKKHATHNRANGELFYGRRGILTYFSLQEAMCELEGDTGYALFPCGMAAMANTILAFVEQGDHVLMANTAYEPNQDFCTKILVKLGIVTGWFDPLISADIVQLIQPEAHVVFLESPDSITMEVHDVSAIVTAVRQIAPETVIMIDNTWVAGILFKALDFDIDISTRAGTKYLIGHSDAMVDTAMASARCWPQPCESAYLMGQMLDADTAYMASRGLHTLDMRLRQHHESSLRIAERLTQHPQVARVSHPALPGSRDHEFWKCGFVGSSELFSFVLNKRLNDAELAEYLDNFSLFSMAYLWGGFESLIPANRPERITHVQPGAEVDFNGTLIRLHIGLENADDLQTDLVAGFARIV